MSGPWERYQTPEAPEPWKRFKSVTQEKLASDPTEGMSTTQRALAGAGKSFYDVARGAGQLVGLVSDEDIESAAALDKSLMGTTAGTLGNIGGHVALSSAMGVPQSALKAGLLGAGYAGLQSGSPSERLFNAALAGGFGAGAQGLSNAVGAVARPSARAHLTPTQSKVLDDAVKLGFKPTPGQVTGSRSAQVLEEGMKGIPSAMTPLQDITMANQKVMNRIALKAFGQSGDNITAEVLDNAHSVLGKKYQALSMVKNIDLDQAFASKVDELLTEATNTAASLQDKGSISVLREYKALAAQGQRLDGRRVLNDLKKLKKQAKDAYRAANSELGYVKENLAGALEDAVESSLQAQGKQDVFKRFVDARQQYAKLFAVEKAVDLTKGNVSGAKLADILQRDAKRTFGRRGSDLDTAASFIKGFPPVISESGTAPRALAQYLLTLGLGGSMVGGLTTGDITGMAGGAAVGLGAPWLMSRAYTSSPVLQNMLHGIQSLQGPAAQGAGELLRRSAFGLPIGALASQEPQ